MATEGDDQLLIGLTQDAHERMSRAVRKVEEVYASSGQGPESPRGLNAGIVSVMVIGPGVPAVPYPEEPGISPTTTTNTSTTGTTTTGTGTTTTSTTTTTTTTSSTTTSTTSGTTSSTGTTTTTTLPQMIVYPGVLVEKDVRSGKDIWYSLYETEEDRILRTQCWIVETNGMQLYQGCVYNGYVVALYHMSPLVAVQFSGVTQDCTSSTGTSTTTTSMCEGECRWELDEPINGCRRWVKVEDTCSEGCGCPPPDFCPPESTIEECGEARTYCHRGDVSIGPACCLPTTTTTGTGTSSTGTTTTTTERANCSGCAWKYVEGIGLIPLVSDCSGEQWTLEDGTVCRCNPCALPPGPYEECVTYVMPCSVPCVFTPPPPPCAGFCTWKWPEVEGMWWVLLQESCNDNQVPGCSCDVPSEPGTACAQVTYTPCHLPTTATETTGTGTTSSTGTVTTTTGPGCDGWCKMGWNTSFGGWIVLEGCPGCHCAVPPYDGTSDCEIAQTRCVPAPTTTTTTTTTTTSTTTTTTTGTTTTTTGTSTTTTTTTGTTTTSSTGTTTSTTCTPDQCELFVCNWICPLPGGCTSSTGWVSAGGNCFGSCPNCYCSYPAVDGVHGEVISTDCNALTSTTLTSATAPGP